MTKRALGKNTAGVLLLANALGGILAYTAPTPSILDRVLWVTAPIGVAAMLYVLHIEGWPEWLKELRFWSVIIGILWLIGYIWGAPQ